VGAAGDPHPVGLASRRLIVLLPPASSRIDPPIAKPFHDFHFPNFIHANFDPWPQDFDSRLTDSRRRSLVDKREGLVKPFLLSNV